MSYSVSSKKSSSSSANFPSFSSSGVPSTVISKVQDADACYVIDSRKIQDNIQSIKILSANIDKLSKANCLTERGTSTNRKELRAYMDTAKQIALQTQSLLKRFGVINGASLHEKGQRCMMHEKLSKSYQATLKELEIAAQNCLLSEWDSKNKLPNKREIRNSYEDRSSLHSVDSSTIGCTSSKTSSVDTSFVFNNLNDFHYSSHSDAENNSKTFMQTNKYNHNESICTAASHGKLAENVNKRMAVVETHPFYTTTKQNNNLKQSKISNDDSKIQQISFEHKYLIPLSVNSQDLEEEMMKERVCGIHQIEQDIKGINKLYTELAWHVHQQEGGIDDIESRMLESATYANDATRQITITRDRQSRTLRKTCFWILTLVAVVLLTLVIITKLSMIL